MATSHTGAARTRRGAARGGPGWLLAWVVMASAGRATLAQAPVPHDVVPDMPAVVLSRCPWDAETIRRIIAVELGDDATKASRDARDDAPTRPFATSPARQRVSISCQADRIDLIASTGEPPRTAQRLLYLDTVAAAATARTIALASVELLSTLQAALRPQTDRRADDLATATGARSSPAAPPTPVAPASAPGPASPSAPERTGGPVGATQPGLEPTVAPAPPRGGDVRQAGPSAISPPSAAAAAAPRLGMGVSALTMAGVWRMFATTAGLSGWGGRLTGDHLFGAPEHNWLASLDIDTAVTQRAVTAGRVRATLLSAGAWLGLPFGDPEMTAILAVGLRVGAVRMSGTPADINLDNGHIVWRPWAGPAVSARYVWGGRFGVDVGLELGMSVLGVAATTYHDTALAARGPWVAASVGFAAKTKKP